MRLRSPASASPSPLATQMRFGSARETKHQSFQAIPKAFQSFVPNDDTAIDYGAGAYTKGGARVDPAAIPLPPQSPPISAVSFSSRSSASRSSVSYETQDSGGSRSTAPTLHSNVNGNGHARQGSKSSQPRKSVDGLGIHSEPMSRDPSMSEVELSDDDAHHHDADGEDEERKMKAAAKSNRKVCGLAAHTVSISLAPLLYCIPSLS